MQTKKTDCKTPPSLPRIRKDAPKKASQRIRTQPKYFCEYFYSVLFGFEENFELRHFFSIRIKVLVCVDLDFPGTISLLVPEKNGNQMQKYAQNYHFE